MWVIKIWNRLVFLTYHSQLHYTYICIYIPTYPRLAGLRIDREPEWNCSTVIGHSWILSMEFPSSETGEYHWHGRGETGMASARALSKENVSPSDEGGGATELFRGKMKRERQRTMTRVYVGSALNPGEKMENVSCNFWSMYRPAFLRSCTPVWWGCLWNFQKKNQTVFFLDNKQW